MDEKTEATVLYLTPTTKFYLYQTVIVACTIPVNYLRPKQIFPKIRVEIEYFLKRY